MFYLLVIKNSSDFDFKKMLLACENKHLFFKQWYCKLVLGMLMSAISVHFILYLNVIIANKKQNKTKTFVL